MAGRRVPWLVVGVMFLIWSYGLFDGYFGEYADAPSPQAMEMSAVFIDRTLRIEDALASQPAVVRRLLFFEDRAEGLESARDLLLVLEKQGLLDPRGTSVLALVRSELGEEVEPEAIPDPLFLAAIRSTEPEPVAVRSLGLKLASGSGKWWDQVLARRLLDRSPETQGLTEGLAVHGRTDKSLLYRSLVSSGIFIVIAVIGLFLVPRSVRELRAGWRAASTFKPLRYHARWEPSLIFAVFLGTDLMGKEFLSGSYFIAAMADTGFVFDVAVDTVWRFLPPLLAALILFRKPRHALRAFGMNRRPEWHLVIAVFAVLFWLNFALYHLMEPFIKPDPSWHLDAMEAGTRGLFYGLLSACIAAPIAEELFYRGLLLRGLEKRLGLAVAAFVSTAAFALVHFYDLHGLISVAIFGFSALVVYRATGSLMTSIALHSLYNLSITVPGWLMYHAAL
jgi:membrane protease YdiL (CAAX protease family)